MIRAFLGLLIALPLFGADYLAQIHGIKPIDCQIIQQVDENYIILVEKSEVLRLGEQYASFRILDENPDNKLYLLVFNDGYDNSQLNKHGIILEQYDDCVLFQTSEDQIRALNNYKLELSRVWLQPIAYQPDFGELPQLTDFRIDTLIEEMVNLVSEDSILASVLRMQHMYTRYTTTDSNEYVAAPWIRDRLIAYGCDSVYLGYFSGTYGPNIIGIKKGLVYPQLSKYCVIGGHMDDVPSSGYAPGADDNASGTTAMLEAARVLRDYDFEYTIKFIGFNAEELGLYGSHATADTAYAHGDTILGVFNYDMIGYVQSVNRDTMNAHYTVAVPGCSLFVCQFYQAVADTYTQLKIRRVRSTGTSGSSDHASYWQRGYKAMLGIERILCPGYHTIGDTVGPSGFNNLPFATKVIKTAVATLAKLAVPIHGNPGVHESPFFSKGLGFEISPSVGQEFAIAFHVLRSGNIDISVFSSLGQRIVDLANGFYESGIYQRTWVVERSIPAGVYFIRCQQDDEQVSRKVIISY
ncbi:hypothetical protein A2Y85_01710 [candidate division WOR-3 bacterium RBG_13_43_14]|uniref:Peptidase M28 domain-containing protein n=1 Tax=candidate division WOR-3 bacterium RBG_13_43_14 TaxID=1802590 RepID=A0A1F4U1Z9_UNCW3|nr:MAG: hypothetical protein A2Y85_01710 [candidate division WOR-3 bacterium RBG_13_43_14]